MEKAENDRGGLSFCFHLDSSQTSGHATKLPCSLDLTAEKCPNQRNSVAFPSYLTIHRSGSQAKTFFGMKANIGLAEKFITRFLDNTDRNGTPFVRRPKEWQWFDFTFFFFFFVLQEPMVKLVKLLITYFLLSLKLDSGTDCERDFRIFVVVYWTASHFCLFFRDMTFVSCLGSHLLRNRPQFL
jgi:hypothetical protein